MKESLSRENWNKRVGLAPWGWLLLGFIMSFGSSPGAPMWFVVGLLAMVIHLVVAYMVADSTEEREPSYLRRPGESQEALISRLAREARGQEFERAEKEFIKKFGYGPSQGMKGGG